MAKLPQRQQELGGGRKLALVSNTINLTAKLQFRKIPRF